MSGRVTSAARALPIGGMSRAMSVAASKAASASSQSELHQGMSVSSNAVSGGIAAFPRSSAKL